MKINSKKILKKLDEEASDRGKVTLYLSKGLFKTFKARCGKHSASAVIEQMMLDFISTTKTN